MIKAASEVTAKGYAKITLLGDPQQVAAEAKKLGADISGCTVVDPKVRAAAWGQHWCWDCKSSACAQRCRKSVLLQSVLHGGMCMRPAELHWSDAVT